MAGVGSIGLVARKGGGGTGLPAKSLDFERDSSQYLEMSNVDFGVFDRSLFSISTWVYIEDSLTGTYPIMSKGGEFSLQIGSGELDFDINDNAATFGGRLVTNTSPITAGSFFYVTASFDFAAAAADRLRLYVDGSELTSFSVDDRPTSQFSANSNAVRVGSNAATSAFFDGLKFQHAFFSGTGANGSTIYNSGTPINIASEMGLYSLLDVRSGDVTSDLKLGTNWQNNSGVTASSTIPS